MKKIWLKIKKPLFFVLEKILFVQTIIILSLVYLLALGPVALLAKLTRRDFLKEKKTTKSFWQEKKKISHTLEEAKRFY